MGLFESIKNNLKEAYKVEGAYDNSDAVYGSIGDIYGVKCYIAGSTQQGYCYKNMNTYENDPDGVCYICESAFENYVMDNDPDKRLYDSYIPVDYVEKNKAKLIEWGSISTKNSIMDEVRAMLKYGEWYYEDDNGNRIEAEDFDNELVESVADEVIDMVDWQTTGAMVNDLDDDSIIGEDIENYYDRKNKGLKESELEHTRDYKQLEKAFDKGTLDKINAVLEHYIDYTNKNDDGEKDIIEEYFRKFGNEYIIDWYEGLMSTEDFINEIKNGYEVTKPIKESGASDEEVELLKTIVADLKNEPLIKKYMYGGTWLSGSSTTVYPITVSGPGKDIEVQLNTDKNVFNGLLKKYENKYPLYAGFWKSDGSCPSHLYFKLKSFYNEAEEARQYDGKVQLQSVGKVNAVKGSNLKPGDIIAFNWGYTAKVLDVEPSASGKTVTVTAVSSDTGNKYTRKYGADRLVPLSKREATDYASTFSNRFDLVSEAEKKKDLN